MKILFFAGSIMTSPVPSNTLSFIVDDKGNAEKFSVHIEGLPEQSGIKVPTYKVEEMQVFSNDHSLAARSMINREQDIRR